MRSFSCLAPLLCSLATGALVQPPAPTARAQPRPLWRAPAVPTHGAAATWATGAAAMAHLVTPAAAHAAEGGLPDDSLVVGFAVLLLALIGLLNLSLGDIAADEAMLPSSVNLINKNRARKSTFIRGKDPTSGGPPA